MKTSTNELQLDHLNFTVNNFQESAAWYGKIFGFKIVEQGTSQDGSPWGILKSGGALLCIYEENKRRTVRKGDPGDEAVHRFYHFALRIHDRAMWEATIAKEKPRLNYGGAYRYPHSTSWYIEDPNGYEIEVALWDRNEIRF